MTRPKRKAKKMEDDGRVKCLCFQDVLQKSSEKDRDQNDDLDSDSAVANAFFELANATSISYRIYRDKSVEIRQDQNQACGQHTGGIVWETSFLLLNYLRQIYGSSPDTKYPCGKNILEVGSGCGLLGLGTFFSKLTKRVVLTETDSVLPNLQHNVDVNCSSLDVKTTNRVRVACLDWTRYKSDCKVASIMPHSMDMIVGTDVVFSTRFVHPLLETLAYLAHSNTTVLLCLQERCPDSHRMLLDSAKTFGFDVEDISKRVTEVPTCEWGKDLDCCILQLRLVFPKKSKSGSDESNMNPKKKQRK